MSLLSRQFGIAVANVQQPVMQAVNLLFFSGFVYLLACWVHTLFDSSVEKKVTYWIVGIGVLCRAVLLPSTPILEIDLYRYLWDGQMVNATGDPFEYAPIEFVQWQYPPENQIAFSRSNDEREWIESFAVSRDPAMQTVLAVMTTHFGQFTTPYPPVSQMVFAASNACCPDGTSLQTRVAVLKLFLVVFDVATGLVLILILRLVGMSSTWSVVWFWSPLVLKEFANGGHLDSIAIFFCTLFALFCVQQMSKHENAFRRSFFAGTCLAAGVSAKIFPFVLVPIWAVMTIRRFGWQAIAPGFVSLVVVVATMAPMLVKVSEFRNSESATIPKPGVLAFAESWEMNDMIFMVVVENLKSSPADENLESKSPWFVVTPESWRTGTSFQDSFDRTRLITLAIFATLVVWLIIAWIRTPQADQQLAFLRMTFLTLAWFWLLSPTQNPWYWCWALPFACFANQKSWLLVSVLTLMYYVRFQYSYFEDEASGISVLDFDFVYPFYQFVPVLLLVAGESIHSIIQPKQLSLESE